MELLQQIPNDKPSCQSPLTQGWCYRTAHENECNTLLKTVDTVTVTLGYVLKLAINRF